MPPAEPKSLPDVVREVGRYPADAFLFVQAALHHTASTVHGRQEAQGEITRHVDGRQLCEGIRDFAAHRWGRLARAVLARWDITETLDFGRIVFALVDAGLMSKTPHDKLEDFDGVFDFATAFERGYRINPKPPEQA